MKKIACLLIFSVSLIASSCTEGPHIPDCATAKFSWKQDGTYHEGYSVMQYSTSYEHYGLTACTGETNAPNVNIRLHLPIAVGTYNLAHIQQATGPNTGDASYFDNGGGSYFTTDSTHTGSVIITSVAGDSAITGTFSMSVYRYGTNTTHTITEGQFTAIK